MCSSNSIGIYVSYQFESKYKCVYLKQQKKTMNIVLIFIVNVIMKLNE